MSCCCIHCQKVSSLTSKRSDNFFNFYNFYNLRKLSFFISEMKQDGKMTKWQSYKMTKLQKKDGYIPMQPSLQKECLKNNPQIWRTTSKMMKNECYFMKFRNLSSIKSTPSRVAAKSRNWAVRNSTDWSISPWGGSSSAQMDNTAATITVKIASAFFTVSFIYS